MIRPPTRTGLALVALAAATVALYRAVLFWNFVFPWDSLDFSYPYALFLNRSLHAGYWPSWNPFSFGGSPFIGNLPTLAFHPPTLLAAWLLPDLTPDAFQVLEVLHIFVGALGLYLWGMARTGSRTLGLVGGVAFAGSGFVVGLASHYTLLALYVLLPYPFAFLTLWDKTRRARHLFLCSLSLTLWLTASYPSLLGYYLLAFALYYGVTRRARPPAFELVLLAVVPPLLAAVHLVPSVARLPDLARMRPLPLSEIAIGSLFPVQLGSLTLGGLATLPSRLRWPEVTMRNVSIGLVGSFGAVYALLRPTRARLCTLLAVLVCVGLALGTHSLLWRLWRHVSFLASHSHYPALDFGGLVSFAALTLALDGVDDLLHRPVDKRRVAFALAVPILAWFYFRYFSANYSPARDYYFERWRNSTLLAPLAAALPLALALLTRPAWPRLAAALLVCAAFCDSAGDVRANSVEVYLRLIAAHPAAQPRAQSDYFDLQSKWPRIPIYPHNTNAFLFTAERADGGFDSSLLQIQESALGNPDARAVLLSSRRAWVADEARVVADPGAVPLLQGTRVVAAFSQLPGALVGSCDLALEIDQPSYARWAVRAPAGCIVVFSDLDIRGWSLRVDGRAAPMARANGFFRAAAFSPGDHRVELRYRPPGFIAGLLLSGLGLLLLIASSWLGRRWRPGPTCP
jgi:hypothetical protein